jgi:poly(hydroxyalkanoate) depolymerase family esterase
MSTDFQALMQEATRLTRSGDLAAAQAAIQAALGSAATFNAPVGAAAPTAPVGASAAKAWGGTAAARSWGGAAAARAANGASAGETIDVIARLIGEPAGPSARTGVPIRPAAAQVPRGAGMVAGEHAAAGLQCHYELFVPAPTTAQPGPRALVVMLHGCTQHPADFAAGTRMNELAQAQGFIVLYPAQSRQMNPQGCWNWFKHSHQRRGHGEPELLASLTRAVMQGHGVDPARVYVAGLSAGGAMASVLGRSYPELYAAVGVHSGLAAGVAHDLPSALAAMNGASPPAASPADGKPVIVFHGDADATVHPHNAAAVVAGSTNAQPTLETVAAGRPGHRRATRRVHRGADGRVVAEHWTVHGAGHAWSGGSPAGSYTDATGPDASAAMWRFFEEHPLEPPAAGRQR